MNEVGFRRWTRLWLVGASALAVLGAAPPQAEVELDDALRAAVVSQLPAGAQKITVASLKALTKLNAAKDETWEGTIRSLKGLEHAINLVELHLGYNNIQDVSPLAGLTRLQFLYLQSNAIADISALESLTALQRLDLDDNKVRDISALGSLPQLKHLFLNKNLIRDLTPLVDNQGIGRGDVIEVRENCLGQTENSTGQQQAAALDAREVTIDAEDQKNCP